MRPLRLLIAVLLLGIVVGHIQPATALFAAQPPPPSPYTLTDQRFALGGGYNWYAPIPLNTKWVYHWGIDIQQNYLFRENYETLLIVGDPTSPTFDPCPDGQPAYDNNGIPLCGFYDRIPAITASNPGAWYAIGNEPDLNNIPPDEYVRWLHTFATEILTHDPEAKISFGGLFYTRYRSQTGYLYDLPNLLDKGTAEGQYFYNNVIKPDDDPATIVLKEENAYLAYILQKYQDTYNQPAPFHWYNIHPYAIGYNPRDGIFNENPVEATIASIENMRAFMALPLANAQHKPLIITEYSIIWEPCGIGMTDFQQFIQTCDQAATTPAGNDPAIHRSQVEYMNEVTAYLATTNHVQRWFWFTASYLDDMGDADRYNAHSATIFMRDLDNHRLNTLGTTYLDLENRWRDNTRPTLNATIRPQTDSYQLTFTATDTGRNPSGIIAYWYGYSSRPLTIDQPLDVSPHWHSDLSITTQHQASIPFPTADTAPLYLNLAVQDAAGNVTYQYELLRPGQATP
ncbi:MAG TPA: hypothetical protein VLL52_13855, partial [Anaerolineae bacterium]|nr:hypothetical protein [Anaerolineae bacterium]